MNAKINIIFLSIVYLTFSILSCKKEEEVKFKNHNESFSNNLIKFESIEGDIKGTTNYKSLLNSQSGGVYYLKSTQDNTIYYDINVGLGGNTEKIPLSYNEEFGKLDENGKRIWFQYIQFEARCVYEISEGSFLGFSVVVGGKKGNAHIILYDKNGKEVTTIIDIGQGTSLWFNSVSYIEEDNNFIYLVAVGGNKYIANGVDLNEGVYRRIFKIDKSSNKIILDKVSTNYIKEYSKQFSIGVLTLRDAKNNNRIFDLEQGFISNDTSKKSFVLILNEFSKDLALIKKLIVTRSYCDYSYYSTQNNFININDKIYIPTGYLDKSSLLINDVPVNQYKLNLAVYDINKGSFINWQYFEIVENDFHFEFNFPSSIIKSCDNKSLYIGGNNSSYGRISENGRSNGLIIKVDPNDLKYSVYTFGDPTARSYISNLAYTKNGHIFSSGNTSKNTNFPYYQSWLMRFLETDL